jgi:hypothetical protein
LIKAGQHLLGPTSSERWKLLVARFSTDFQGGEADQFSNLGPTFLHTTEEEMRFPNKKKGPPHGGRQFDSNEG